MDTGTRLEGVAELTKQLYNLGRLDDGKVLRKAVRAGIQPAFDRALATMPVAKRSHRLSKTYGGALVEAGYAKAHLGIKTRLQWQTALVSAFIADTAPAFYAVWFVEEVGSWKMAARPWLRPAFYAARGDMEQAFHDSLQKSVDQIVRRNARG